MNRIGRKALSPVTRGNPAVIGPSPAQSCRCSREKQGGKVNRVSLHEKNGLSLAALTHCVFWSGRWESNPRRSAWEADILPLNYARSSGLLYPDPALRSRSLQFKGHCEHPQGARQSLMNGEIVTLPPTLRSGLRLTAMTWAYRRIRVMKEAEFNNSDQNLSRFFWP